MKSEEQQAPNALRPVPAPAAARGETVPPTRVGDLTPRLHETHVLQAGKTETET